MVTKKEPYKAERLLLSTGITNHYMESNWDDSTYSAVGRCIETPVLDIRYRSERAAQFSKGERPPARPYIRGFASAEDDAAWYHSPRIPFRLLMRHRDCGFCAKSPMACVPLMTEEIETVAVHARQRSG